jgi:hypothetical protein
MQAWRLSGDVYAVHPGDKPWISEMYGYIFSAAKHNMWHQILRTAMLYPGYYPRTVPQLLHYGLTHTVNTTKGKFSFDKHWHFDFNPMQCPPWVHLKGRDGGVFERAPSPADLWPTEVCASVSIILLCQHYRSACLVLGIKICLRAWRCVFRLVPSSLSFRDTSLRFRGQRRCRHL